MPVGGGPASASVDEGGSGMQAAQASARGGAVETDAGGLGFEAQQLEAFAATESLCRYLAGHPLSSPW